MWPLGHAAGAYLLASLGAERQWLSRPDIALVVAVLVGSQLPDLVDKPFAWFVPILPAGRSLGHSLFFLVPICVGLVLLAQRLGRREVGVAMTLAVGSHLLLDLVPVLWGGSAWEYLLWPLLTVEGYDTAPSIVAMFEDSLDDPWFHAELVLAALALYRWRADGYPGLAWLWQDDGSVAALRKSGEKGD